MYLTIWLYRRETRAGARGRVRAALAALRVIVIAGVLLIWLDPVRVQYRLRTILGRVAVLVDDSASMRIADVAGAPRQSAARHDAVRALMLGDDAAWLRGLEQRNELAVYAFGDRVERLALPWQEPATGDDALQPVQTGLHAARPATDLGSGLQRVLADSGEVALAGVVILSDGVVNTGLPPAELPAELRDLRVPVHVVGVGASEAPPNLRVADLSGPSTAAQGDPLELAARLSSTEPIERDVPVELRRRAVREDATLGPAEVVARETVTLGGESPTAEAVFRIQADDTGDFVFEIEAAPLLDEAAEFDNTAQALVRVLDMRARVLLVAGRPSYDYRYVTRLLERDESIEVACWLQSADTEAVRDGDEILTSLPRQPEDLFDYDAILLLDPRPEELDESWAVSVHRFVDELGGGLLFQAGTHFAARLLHDARLEEVVKLLPIVPDPDAELRLSEYGAFRTASAEYDVPGEAPSHPLIRFSSDPQSNQRIWNALAPAWWRLPIEDVKPLATVLLRHGTAGATTANEGPPLLVVQPVGSGRAVFLATDETWRWRGTAEAHFNHFWIQLVRYLAQGRRAGASRYGTIVLDRPEIRPGDLVRVETRLLDEHFQPWRATGVEARLERSDAPAQPLQLVPAEGREGWFVGRFVADWRGLARIRVPLPATGTDPPGALVKYVYAEPAERELERLAASPAALEPLTQRTGGELLTLEQARQLPTRIESASRQQRIRGTEEALWDEWWVLAAIASLLALEWGLRRRSYLL